MRYFFVVIDGESEYAQRFPRRLQDRKAAVNMALKECGDHETGILLTTSGNKVCCIYRIDLYRWNDDEDEWRFVGVRHFEKNTDREAITHFLSLCKTGILYGPQGEIARYPKHFSPGPHF